MNRFIISLACFCLIAFVTPSQTDAAANSVCPFCSAVNATFAEQFRNNHVVVIAELVKLARPVNDLDVDLPKAELEIVEVEKGGDFVTKGMRFKALLVGSYDVGQKFLVMGIDPPSIVWSTPLKANDRVIEYVKAVQKLPEDNSKRLLFFQMYFEDADSVLAYDAYDEFAQAKYSELVAIKEQMDRKQLLKWIVDNDVPINRRRLYLTMLGVCGEKEDAKQLEEIIRSGDRDRQAGLDALVAAYLMLMGEPGMDVVDKELIDNAKAEDIQLLSVRAALAFHTTEAKVVSKERLLVSLRKFLNNPKIADAVIPDLARLQDWSVSGRLMELFKTADEDSKWVRVPIVQYFQACPLPEAKTNLEELKKLDPDSIKRALFLSDFDFDAEEKKPEADSQKPKKDEKSEDNDKVVSKKVPVENLAKSLFGEIVSGGPAAETFTSAKSPPLNGKPNSPGGVINPGPLETASDTAPPSVALINTNSKSIAKLEDPSTNPSTVGGIRLGIAIVTFPMIASACIFLLIWSVISGWFERLIF